MKKKLCVFALIVLTAIFAVSTYFLLTQNIEDKKQMNDFEEIQDIIDDNSNDIYSLGIYSDLYKQNSDFMAWIKIEGTNINYPVMRSKNNPNYYLNHNFNKEYSRFGVPYMQEDCDMQSDNIVIYGHNMQNKSMFNELTNYKSRHFYEKHKNIIIDSVLEHRKYEVIAVFKTVAYESNSFEYYNFVNASTEEDYRAYIEKCKALSLYDTGIDAKYGDKLITLSTCEYSQDNGRFVVVAKLVD